MSDTPLDRLAAGPAQMSMVLAAKILALFEDSGATHVEANAALNMVSALMPTMDHMAYTPASLHAEDQTVDP